MSVPNGQRQVRWRRSSPRLVTSDWRCAVVGAALGLMFAGCGSTTKTVTSTGGASPTQTQAAARPTPVIELQRGIGTAALGMSEAQVEQSLGPPLRADQVRNNTGPYTELTYPDRLTIAFQRGGSYSGGASSFFVKGTTIRTRDGIGVGSTEADVKAHVAGTICEMVTTYRSCHLGKYQVGQTITEFQIDGGRVTHVRVALIR